MDPETLFTVGEILFAIVGAISSGITANNTRITLNEIQNKLDEIERLIVSVLDAIADLKVFVLTNSEDQFRNFISSEIDALLHDYNDKVASISDLNHLTAQQRSEFLQLAEKVKNLGYQLFDWGGAAYPAAAEAVGLALVYKKLGHDQTETPSMVGQFITWFNFTALVQFTNAATAFQNEITAKQAYVNNFPKKGFLGDGDSTRMRQGPDGPEVETDDFSYYYDISSQNLATGFSYSQNEISTTERSANQSNPRNLPTPPGLGLSTPPEENLKEIIDLLNAARADAQKAQTNLALANHCISDIQKIVVTLQKAV